ncbi:hypothetical protein PtA15_3A247 [Puccinia triticina]|uniref:Aldehyde dehydrogenase domain-containing protein n=1 Tax=Puccinia triticina TaxID=208348 RepID=A0ABY7CEH5_9BASI|nr:uncharacterized protein PtA15_3A247 [Puccinia triticina]WAQ82882.1 hypothetical protein PtA15_3A247 [Puccinia triticina]
MNLADLGIAIKAATEVFLRCRHSTAAVRQSYLRKFNGLILANAKDLAENGKSWKDALSEVNYAASFVEFFATETLRTDGIIVPSSTPAFRHLVIIAALSLEPPRGSDHL